MIVIAMIIPRTMNIIPSFIPNDNPEGVLAIKDFDPADVKSSPIKMLVMTSSPGFLVSPRLDIKSEDNIDLVTVCQILFLSYCSFVLLNTHNTAITYHLRTIPVWQTMLHFIYYVIARHLYCYFREWYFLTV